MNEQYFYTTNYPHRWSSEPSFFTTDSDHRGPIESLARAKELAEAAKNGKWGEKDFCETTYGSYFTTS